MRNIFDDRGGIAIDPISCLTDDTTSRRYLFGDAVKRFSVHRPIDSLGDPAPQASIRAGAAKDLFCSVSSSVTPGSTVEYGAPFSYRIFVRNDRSDAVSIRIEFRPDSDCYPDRECSADMILKSGESTTISFEMTAVTSEPVVKAPSVTVNGLSIWAPTVPVGKSLPEKQGAMLRERVLSHMGETGDFLRLAGDLYRSVGRPFIPDCPLSPEVLRRLFFLHDTQIGNVLSRRTQAPLLDGCVYSLFGGIGVITPQNAAGDEVRTTYLSVNHLQTGDLILCAEDALFQRAWSCMWTGKEMVGSFDHEAPFSVMDRDAADRFVDSLPGRFCFAIVRPALFETDLAGGMRG